MTILSISRDWGTTPSIVRITDSANLSTITATGYVFEQSPVIEAIQKGEFEWAPTDEVLISYADGKGYFTYNPLTGTFIAQEDPFGTVTAEEVQRAAFNTSAATGANDAFVVTLSPAATALTDGLTITMDSGAFQNLTASPTLKVNALPAKPIVTFAGSPAPGDIQQNNEYIFVYSLTNNHFQLINPSTSTADTFQVQSSGYSYALDTGVANAYIANILPVQLTTQSGLQIIMTAINANTGASTLTVNGVTHTILLSNGAALTGGEILVNGIYQFFYSAALTGFVLMNPSISAAPSNAQANVTYTGADIQAPAIMFNYTSVQVNGEKFNNLLTAYMFFPQVIGPTTIDFGNVQALGISYNTASTLFLGTGTTSISFPSLIYSQMQIQALCPLLTTCSMPVLKYAMNGIALTVASLVTLSLPDLVITGSPIALVAVSMTTLNLPSLVLNTGVFSQTLALLTSLNLTSLTTVTGAMQPVFAVLTTFSVPALVTVTGIFGPTLASATTITLTSLATLRSTMALSAASVTTLSLPAIISVATTFTITAANLVTFSLGSTLKSVGGNFTMTGMKLNQASVDGILVSLAALDGTGGTTAYSSKTVNLSGGTSSAPSATGLAAKATLEGRGCTVTVN
ncbi:hypothetical protein [Thiocapsa sp. N5-Cardenillas]|uniref:hypothetical protein n=1 Tax=Thiocapsa sp. N5-Cardenillas TaxID=3137397 RepID=UPI0035B2710D